MGIMNSINMLDNMDGITASVSLVILLTLITSFFITGYTANFYFILISGIACALIGFLVFNWHPSKMFMGDSGSQFLGIFLSAVGIIFFWNMEPLNNPNICFVKKIIIPILAFIIPIVDTTTVVINRISRGHSPFIGGKDHTTHNLARIGLKDNHVAITVVLISFISGLIILYVYNNNAVSTGKALSLVCYILLIFITLFSITRIKIKGTKP
jgi:UDP-GlcNAc:undecaprenyl-phosphate GlcNAc-1-phosphate transferase